MTIIHDYLSSIINLSYTHIYTDSFKFLINKHLSRKCCI